MILARAGQVCPLEAHEPASGKKLQKLWQKWPERVKFNNWGE
jgi:hypothetical protein